MKPRLRLLTTSRIAKLEHLDEIEELRLVLSHYCVAWATRGQRFSDLGLDGE